jgi:thioredoxin-like negative regulator of GroEL
VVPPPSEATQRREAKKLVPDFGAQKLKPKPAREASEDGLIPSGELDRTLGDMAVLLRYGHEPQAARELEQLRRKYPQDLLLLRRIGEFWSESGRTERALETLFALASGLFERRNVEGMRQALEQAKQLDPTSERAARLLSLLDARPDSIPPKK